MPVTPFHFGPAALLKALIPSRFSFFVFCYAQVITDLEVAFHILTHQRPLHGLAHTYIGAIVIGIFCGITALPLHKFLYNHSGKSFFHKLMLRELSVRVSIVSALIGTLSHVFLDSLMHGDIEPFGPFSGANTFLGLVSLSSLHLFCVLTGIVGIAWCERLTKNLRNKD